MTIIKSTRELNNNEFMQKLISNCERDDKKYDKRLILFKIIAFLPGIRYRDLMRITKFNNGTLSHHLTILEKNSVIRVLRSDNSNITRYYPLSIPSEETLIMGYLKMKTTKKIIIFLHDRYSSTFTEICSHINRVPSTTSWNLKRLFEADIITKTRNNEIFVYKLKNPTLVEKIIKKMNHTFIDKAIDSYTSLIDSL